MSSNPQTFNIVKCYNCSTYQVDINKKSTNKWQCKLCGSKQTLKQVFYESDSAKDCRERVKQLNSLNGERQMQQQNANLARHLNSNTNNYDDDNDDEYEQDNRSNYNQSTFNQSSSNNKVSKWAKYLTKKEFNKYYGDEEDEENQDEQNKQEVEKLVVQNFNNNNNNYNTRRNFY